MSYIITNNQTAALDNLLHTQDSVNPIKHSVSPTPSKKAKYSPVTNLDPDLETEATKQSVKEGYGVPISNHSGFVFQWKDIKHKCKKVTAVVTLPSGVDPANVSIKLLETTGRNEVCADRISFTFK